jgi:hypothetical protein
MYFTTTFYHKISLEAMKEREKVYVRSTFDSCSVFDGQCRTMSISIIHHKGTYYNTCT